MNPRPNLTVETLDIVFWGSRSCYTLLRVFLPQLRAQLLKINERRSVLKS